MVAGCHLEGPYLSAEDGPRGAHPREHVRPTNWDEFCELQRVSGERIRLVTIAPEVPHAVEFIRRAIATSVTIAIGHTAASAEQIHASVEAGATLSTHLGNGAHPVLRELVPYLLELGHELTLVSRRPQPFPQLASERFTTLQLDPADPASWQHDQLDAALARAEGVVNLRSEEHTSNSSHRT